MQASLEFLTAVIRFWEGEGSYGAPYDWCATVRWLSPTTVEILGITKPPTKSTWDAVRSELAEYGVQEIKFYRFKNGTKREHTISVSVSPPKEKAMSKKVSEVSLKLEVKWDEGQASPGHEQVAIWRNIPEEGLLKIQSELTKFGANMVDFGLKNLEATK